jgi:diguanylate cyclase (GGDEF)-like protein
MPGDGSSEDRVTAPVGSSDQVTRSARAVRTVTVRWFALLTIPWAGLLAVLAFQLSFSGPLMLLAIAAGMSFVAVTGLLGVRQILTAVDQLDQERHGLREAYDRARLDSLRDPLTGLGNHRAFQEELDEAVKEARATGAGFALLYLDVDDLKGANDAGGHAAGDDLLRATARIMTANMRRGDRAYRIGGDEFAILLAECGTDDGLTIGRRILAAALNGAAGTTGTGPFSVTIGISAYPEPAADRPQLLHQADAALYWGKRHGRTDVTAFDRSRHGMAEDNRSLDELAGAVARVAAQRLLTPAYQPIYDLRTGTVAGFEGLVRPTAESGFPNASALFVAAEASGRTVELDMASLETVIAGALRLDEPCYLSVNLSPRTLETKAFSPFELLSMARRHGIDPTRLVVELTEREAVEDLDQLRRALGALRRHGVRIAADDVGAGNAGLRLLSEVTFDVLKIDLSLVRSGVAREPADGVLRALRDMATRRHQRIVAEGVETTEQLEAVMALGIDAAQGYLLGRPGPRIAAPAIDLRALAELAVLAEAG